jgi:hypothetical protein
MTINPLLFKFSQIITKQRIHEQSMPYTASFLPYIENASFAFAYLVL